MTSRGSENDARQNADDLVRLTVERQRPADHVAVAAVAAHPCGEAEERLAGLTRTVIVRAEQLPEQRLHAEHRQQIGRDADRADSFGLAVAGQIGIGANRNGDILEAPLPFLMSKYCAVENQSSVMPRPGDVFQRMTCRSAFLYGSGRSSSALATLKIAVLAPMPIASDSTATMEKPGVASRARMA